MSNNNQTNVGGPSALNQSDRIVTNVKLSYRLHGETTWKVLDSPQNKDWNVKLSVGGGVDLLQATQGHKALVHYQRDQLEFVGLREATQSVADRLDGVSPDYVLELNVRDNTPKCSWSDPFPSRTHVIRADRLPIAVEHKKFAGIRCLIHRPDDGKVPNWSRQNMLSLLDTDKLFNPKGDITDYISLELAAVAAESNHILNVLNNLERGGSTITTEVWENNSILLKITPPYELHGGDWEQYLFKGAYIDVTSDNIFNVNAPYYVRPSVDREDDGFVARVVHGLNKAPITAILAHDFGPVGLQALASVQETGCQVVLSAKDIGAQRAQHALDRVGPEVDEQDVVQLESAMKKISMFAERSIIPLRNLLLEDEPAITEEVPLLPSNQTRQRHSLHAYLNDDQQTAIDNVYRHVVSLVHGPPGCAKTATAVAMVEDLCYNNAIGKIVVVSPSHTAADEIARKLKDRVNKVGLTLPFTRLLSHDQAETEVREGQTTEIQHTYFHRKCYDEASNSTEGYYANYVSGWNEIQKHGFIRNRSVRSHYVAERAEIFERMLKEFRVIICTCATSGLKSLAKSFKAEMIIIDEAACARTPDILVPLVSFDQARRLVLIGDPKQLGVVVRTNEGQARWANSLFETLQKRGWPSTLLKTNYRSHSALCRPFSDTFYEGAVHAARGSDLPGRFLQIFLHNLRGDPGTLISADGKTSNMSTFCHFINVTNSHASPAGSSSTNYNEQAALASVLKATIQTGTVDPSDIMVLSGYRAMVKDIRDAARQQSWNPHGTAGAEVTISTIHSAQGSEKPVVILCLTRSDGNLQSSFLNSARIINVAISRASQALFIIGDWKAVTKCDRTSPIRKVFEHMYKTIPNFLLAGGRTPFTFPHSDVLDPSNRIITIQVRILRDQRARELVDEKSKEMEDIRSAAIRKMSEVGYRQWMRGNHLEQMYKQDLQAWHTGWLLVQPPPKARWLVLYGRYLKRNAILNSPEETHEAVRAAARTCAAYKEYITEIRKEYIIEDDKAFY